MLRMMMMMVVVLMLADDGGCMLHGKDEKRFDAGSPAVAGDRFLKYDAINE